MGVKKFATVTQIAHIIFIKNEKKKKSLWGRQEGNHNDTHFFPAYVSSVVIKVHN